MIGGNGQAPVAIEVVRVKNGWIVRPPCYGAGPFFDVDKVEVATTLDELQGVVRRWALAAAQKEAVLKGPVTPELRKAFAGPDPDAALDRMVELTEGRPAAPAAAGIQLVSADRPD